VAWSVFFVGLGLLFVFEGILPFVSPNFWRQLMQQMFASSDRALRIVGLISMLFGLAVITITGSYF
jgi:uncharacterized protein YjeT (DUF2065 family)